MTTELEFPSRAECEALCKVYWASLRPDAWTGPGSDVWLFSKIGGKILHGLHWTIERGYRKVFPGTCSGFSLDWWLWAVCGPPGRLQKKGSVGTACLRVYAEGGTISAGALQNTQWKDDSGQLYKITDSNAAITDGNYEDMDLQAISTGSSTNLETGTVLTAISPPSYCKSTASLVADLDEGRDLETEAEGRQRLLEALQLPSLSGNAAQIRRIVEAAVPGNLRAYVWPKRQGYPYGWGTVDVAALQVKETGSAKVITSAIEALITAAVKADLPTQTWYNWRLLNVQADATAYDFTVEMGPGASLDKRCDWDAESIKTTVSSSSSSLKRISATANICSPTVTNGVEVGDRVLISNQEAVVDGVNQDFGSGADAKNITVSTWPWSTSINSAKIATGGGIISTILADQKTYCDTLGPSRGDAADENDGWDDTMRVKHIQKAALDSDSDILDVVVNDIGGGGAVDKSPTASTGTDVYWLTYGTIVPWMEWFS